MAPQMAARRRSAPMPAQTGPRQATFKDEFGFRYDSEGNRLDARGNIIFAADPLGSAATEP